MLVMAMVWLIPVYPSGVNHLNFEKSPINMKKSIFLLLFSFSLCISNAQVDTILWLVDNLSQIGGHDVQVIGTPEVITTDIGMAIEFDGIDDGLIVDGNPVAGATAFTVEIIFKPYSGGEVEQRFLHMQQDNDNRLLIELRNPSNENWTLDTFIKAGTSSQALLDYSFVHALDEWAHAALVYKDGAMEHYVNGEKELEGTVNYQVVNSGETSLGVRLNQVSWFKGAIHSVRVTHDALSPDEFLPIDMISNTKQVSKEILDFQLLPNPIQDVGLLKYKIPSATNIAIQLFDIHGQKLSSFFEGFKNAGSHEIKIHRNELPAGLYFLVMDDGNNRVIQKCLFH